MTEKITTPLSERFKFTEPQRAELAALLRPGKAKSATGYLKIVEELIFHLRIDAQATANYPSPPISEELAVLDRIAKHARGLFCAIRDSNTLEGQLVVRGLFEQYGLDSGAINYIENHLPFLFTSAERATKLVPKSKRGRPPDLMEQNFIAVVASYYYTMFGKRPPYSRNSSFPVFVSRILKIALPGNPHTADDNSKIVKAALESAGLVHTKSKPKNRPRGRS